MLTNYIFMIPIKMKISKDLINAYLKHVPATFGGSTYILSDRGREFSSKQFTWLAKEVGFTNVYPSPCTTTGNSVLERTHIFLKATLQTFISEHDKDLNSIANIVGWHIMYFHIPPPEKPLFTSCSAEMHMCLLYLNY